MRKRRMGGWGKRNDVVWVDIGSVGWYEVVLVRHCADVSRVESEVDENKVRRQISGKYPSLSSGQPR